jgi:hypothetical protein
LQLAAVPVRHGKVQRTEVLVERHVSQVLSKKTYGVRNDYS